MRASALLLGGVVLLSACAQSCKQQGGAAASDPMALVPKEADIVVHANFDRLRATNLWKRMLDFRDSNEQTKKEYEDFVKRCNLDPFAQLESVFAALPASGENKEYAVI